MPAKQNEKFEFLISAVVAVYNVERYLPAFLRSLETQTFGIQNVQLVFVDDGSTDDGLLLLQEWAAARASHVEVLSQPNAWVAEARNAGLDRVRGEWVTFTDPDDVLDPTYFQEVAKFIDLYGDPERAEPVNLLAAHQMRLMEDGEIRDNHPQRRKFGLGSRIVNLHADPIIQLSVNSSFMRTAFVRAHNLRFDDRVRPNFEDGHFIAKYMLATDSMHMGLMASAKYLYRVRGDGTSLIEKSFRLREKYTNVLEHGYLDALETAQERLGSIPRWLQNTVLYDLFWYYKEQLAVQSLSASAPVDVLPRFHELAHRIRRLLDDDAIRSFDLMWVDFPVREAFNRGYDEPSLRHDYVRLSGVDEGRQQVKISYWFSGDLPSERFEVDGVAVLPQHETVRDYEFYGRVLIRERHVWLDRGLRSKVVLDGVMMRVARGDDLGHPEGLSNRQINPFIMRQRRQVSARFAPDGRGFLTHVKGRTRASLHRARVAIGKTNLYDEALEFALRTRSTRNKYLHAWVFMDRDTDANDNAEHLYRWVRKNRPSINAWFVLRRDSNDWGRLEAEGFRLVAHGTWEWKLLMLHADHLASSHADVYVTQPLPQRRYGRSRFKYTFLQHGVIHNDLSRWLSWKQIDVLVTTTPAEYEAIAGPGPYSFSSHEVALTGLPRHDSLLEKRRSVDESDRDIILVMPTWRQNLLGERVEGSNERKKLTNFRDSDYARQYRALLRSPELEAVARDAGKTLAFMPHPNMRVYLNEFDLPAHVRLLDFSKDGVQDVLARTAAFVTDYSSLAFDAALLDIPLTYFQFDKEAFFDGQHVGRPGYFDYTEHGFGPVVRGVDEVVDVLTRFSRESFVSPDSYRKRTAETFTNRDGRSSERVIDAMLALGEVPAR